MKDILLKYNQTVPRYTSYPTAPHFTDMTGQVREKWLQALLPQESVSLYVHVPFCQEMCWYCGCHTAATRQYQPVSDYLTILKEEIHLVRASIGSSAPVAHLHFGGGSPSMLRAEDFKELMSCLKDSFSFGAETEIALEADPRGVTPEKVKEYAGCGVNRASFGIQDFTPEVQKAINRVQGFDTVSEALRLYRAEGIDRINFDLMYGLPLQTVDRVLSTVDLSLRLCPQRIALFGYAHVPWMKKHMRLIRDEELPDAGARIDQFEAAAEKLKSEGYHPIGIDHFVREDDEMFDAFQRKNLARNFQGYTTDRAETLIGLGVSSISRHAEGYVQNAANMVQYRERLSKESLPALRGIALTDEDRLRADIISDLMCYFEADVGSILDKRGFLKTHLDAVLALLKDMEEDGCLLLEDRRVTVLPRFRSIVRVVASRFDDRFTHSLKRHAQAV